MKHLGLSDVNTPTPILNDNQGGVDWVESGCKTTKKLRYKNISGFKMSEARLHKEINILWIPGETNPAGIFTKEDKDARHYKGLQDQIFKPREDVFNI